MYLKSNPILTTGNQYGGHDDQRATRAQLITTPAKTLHDLLKQFSESLKAIDQLGLVMEAYKLFLAEMGGTSLFLAFRCEFDSNQSISSGVLLIRSFLI